ncbi:MAG TPA: DUF6541 family protein [Acidimicrobiales bacterium]|nr:DUF6541 family protein [Acidimicrobiales bacterium]
MIWVALSYLVVATVALWPSIRPGRTLVPADDLIIATPYSTLPGAHEPHNLQLSDATFQFFPWFTFLAEGLRHGEIRQWNPTLLGGLPVTPNGNISAYYPPTWLAAVLSPFDAYDLFVLLHLVIGALGIYLLSRVLGARAGPAWVAGLLAFTAAFWVHWSTHLVHLAGMVWVPWVLAATTWLLTADGGPYRRRMVALAAVVGLWLLGGSPQYLYYGGLALLAWSATVLVVRRLRGGAPLLRPGLAFAGALVLGSLVAAPVLLPTLTTAGGVARQKETQPQTEHVPKKDAIRALVPDATGNAADGILRDSSDELRMDSPFVGVTGLLLAAAGAAGMGRRSRGRWLLVAAAGAVLVLAFTGLPHRVLYAVLPGYNRFRSSPRWLFLLPAFALPLAALGLQDLLGLGAGAPGEEATTATATAAGRARLAVLATAAIGAAAVAVWFVHARSEPGAPTAYFGHRAGLALGLLAVVAGGAWMARSRPRLTLVVVALAALVEVGFNTPRWYPRVPQRGAYPEVAVADIAAQRGGRIVRVGARTPFGPFAPDLATEYGVDDVQGLSVLFPADYDRFLRLIDHYGLYARIANIAPPLRTADRLESPLLDVLDVRTVVAERDVPIPAAYPLLVPLDTEPWVYARTSPGPAIVVATATPATEAQMWDGVAAAEWDPTKTAAVVGLRTPVAGSGGTVASLPAPADRELWDVDAPAGGFLRVGSRWDAGWTATVDGRPATVLRADGIFRGVVVPAGHHQVRFTYRNPGEMHGRLLAVVGAGGLACLLVPWSGKSRRGRQPNTPRHRSHE